jgi:RNA polymerase sigma-70 factor (ECF subfamily)
LAVSESSVERYTLHDPDVRLMLAVRDDNAAAFEELMLRYQNRLVTVLEHLVGDRQQAEDLAQDVFLRVYRARKRYVPGAKFSTWLFTIANNVASNALRSRSRRREIHLAGRASGPLGANPLENMIQATSGLMPARQLDKAEMRDVVRVTGMNYLLCIFSFGDIAPEHALRSLELFSGQVMPELAGLQAKDEG